MLLAFSVGFLLGLLFAYLEIGVDMHKIFLVALALFALIAFSQVSKAYEVFTDLSWTAPTTREDGSELDASLIAGYNIYWSDDAVTYSLVGDTPELSYTVTHDLEVSVDKYTFLYAVTTIGISGRESQYSNIVLKSFLVKATSSPIAPGGLGGSVRCGNGCQIDESLVIEGMGISLQ